jgi:hypothetical protein
MSMVEAIHPAGECPLCRESVDTWIVSVMGDRLCNACGAYWSLHNGQYVRANAAGGHNRERCERPCRCGVRWVSGILRRCIGCNTDRWTDP